MGRVGLNFTQPRRSSGGGFLAGLLGGWLLTPKNDMGYRDTVHAVASVDDTPSSPQSSGSGDSYSGSSDSGGSE